MKKLLFGLLAVLPLFAQPATTTVADTFYTAVGPSYCSGTLTVSWDDFYSMDGYLIKAGTQSVTVSAMGSFSAGVVPTNTNTTPPSGIYSIRYNLQPANCASTSEFWNVPASGSSVDLNMVRTLPSPPPSLIPIASLYPPIVSGTQTICFYGGIVQWSASCSAAGGGTVTEFSSGGLSPLFTTTVSDPSSTPTQSFALDTQSAHAFFGGPTTGTASPTFREPSCSDISNAAGGCSMSTAAGGDLSGTLPSPTVTNGSHITNSSIPNSGLANPSMTVGGATCSLGGSCTPSGGGGFIQPLTAPVSGDFTPLNFNTGSGVTTVQSNNSSPVPSISMLQNDPSATQEIAALAKNKLASTFTVTIAFSAAAYAASDGAVVGLFLYDGSGNCIILGMQEGNTYRAPGFSSLNGSFSFDVFGAFVTTPFPVGPLAWFRIQETASARNYYISHDGVLFALVATESNTAHFTTTQYGFAAENRGGAGSVGITMYSFAESNP